MEYVTANILGAIPVLFILHKRPDLAKPMIIMGLLAMPLALFDLLYMPDYWVPKTLFNIPIGVEGFIFSFEAGALAAGIYAFVKNQKFQKTKRLSDFLTILPLLAVLPTAYIFSLFFPINIALSMYIGLAVGILSLLALRRSLPINTCIAAFSFVAVYFIALLVWANLFPHTPEWFTLTNLPRIFIYNVPIYEIIFAALFAAFWSNLYQHIFGYKLVDRRTNRRTRGVK